MTQKMHMIFGDK